MIHKNTFYKYYSPPPVPAPFSRCFQTMDQKFECVKHCGFRVVNGQLQDAPASPAGLKTDRKYGLARRCNNIISNQATDEMTTYTSSVDDAAAPNGVKTYTFTVCVTEPLRGSYDGRFSEKLWMSFRVRVIGPENDILAAGTDREIRSAIPDFF